VRARAIVRNSETPCAGSSHSDAFAIHHDGAKAHRSAFPIQRRSLKPSRRVSETLKRFQSTVTLTAPAHRLSGSDAPIARGL
jgi:hypothetical protein